MRQGYEMAYNHFIVRQKLSSSFPTFAKMVPSWRPSGIDDHFIGWDALAHAGLPALK